jgi:hypothetical protein
LVPRRKNSGFLVCALNFGVAALNLEEMMVYKKVLVIDGKLQFGIERNVQERIVATLAGLQLGDNNGK